MDANFIAYVENYIIGHEWSIDDISKAIYKMAKMRATLNIADNHLYRVIYHAVEEYCYDNNCSIDDLYDRDDFSSDPDEIIFELFND